MSCRWRSSGEREARVKGGCGGVDCGRRPFAGVIKQKVSGPLGRGDVVVETGGCGIASKRARTYEEAGEREGSPQR